MTKNPTLVVLGWCIVLSIFSIFHQAFRGGENLESSFDAANVVGRRPERHVLYALSGNHSSFIKEFEVSLKSVLLNAPPSNPLKIHVMADQLAYDSLNAMFDTLVNTTTFPLLSAPIAILVHNVQAFVYRWMASIEANTVLAATMTKRLRLYGHTVGTWFRLFANDVFQGDLDGVMYLDSDVVIMANVEDIWSHQLPKQSTASATNESLFFWGESQCAGFMILRPKFQDRIWDLYKQAPRSIVKKVMEKSNIVSDQHIFQVVQAMAPEVVGNVGYEWDVSVVNPLWMKGLPSRLDIHRPNGVGMMHFNGGGTSPVSFFEAGNPVHFGKDKHWNLAKYYVDLPWSWAFFQMSSRRGSSSATFYPLQISFQDHVTG